MADQLLTANVANNLYWLGRYLERIESALIEILYAFDRVIDDDKNVGKKLYKRFGIDIKYKNANDFLCEALFGDHDANIYTLSTYIKENAIISRSYIDFKAFGTMNDLSDSLKTRNNDTKCDIDCAYIEDLLGTVSEIWGQMTRKEERNNSDYFLRLGKLVEKVDFHLRLKKDKAFSIVIMDEIDSIVLKLSPESKFEAHHERESYDTILNSINGKINKIIIEN